MPGIPQTDAGLGYKSNKVRVEDWVVWPGSGRVLWLGVKCVIFKRQYKEDANTDEGGLLRLL